MYLSAADAGLLPPGVLIPMSTAPGALGGETAVIWVSELMVKLAAGVLPKLTAVALVK